MKKMILNFLTFTQLLIFILSGCGGGGEGDNNTTTFKLIIPATYKAPKNTEKTIPDGKPIKVCAISKEYLEIWKKKEDFNPNLILICSGVTQSGGTIINWQIENEHIGKLYMIGVFIILDTIKYGDMELEELLFQEEIDEADKILNGNVYEQDESDLTYLTPGGRTLTFKIYDSFWPDEE